MKKALLATLPFFALVASPSVWAQSPHDLAVVAITAPKSVSLKAAAPSVTKAVKVTIQNLGPEPETIPDGATLRDMVTLVVTSLGACPGPTATLTLPNATSLSEGAPAGQSSGQPAGAVGSRPGGELPGGIQGALPDGPAGGSEGEPGGVNVVSELLTPKKFPLVVPPNKKLVLSFSVTFACDNDPVKTTAAKPGHSDYSYTAILDYTPLGGAADSVMTDDICPRAATAGVAGCTTKGLAVGSAVTTDIVGAVNRTPVAAADLETVDADTATAIPVLVNDSDPDGDTIGISGVGAPAHGAASITGSTAVYTPQAGYKGADSFTYAIDDGHGGVANSSVSLTVAEPPLAHIASSSPANGETGVSLERETIVHFSRPLDPAVTIDGTQLFAEFGGSTLPTLIHIANDRRSATLFYQADLPAAARVRVTLDADTLIDDRGRALDADSDGTAGGTAVMDFDTLSLATIPGTAVAGRVFASELGTGAGGGSVNVPLAGVTIEVDGAEDTMSTTTDAMGNYLLDPAPAGPFFVSIDGRTATVGVPPGSYYPYVGKLWQGVPGKTVNQMDVFLPLIGNGTLQSVSAQSATTVDFTPEVQAAHPELDLTHVTVPADALFSSDGTHGGMVGIAPVPTDRLPGPLPPGLELPLVITVQTNGPGNFDSPAPVCFPNLDDLPAGTASALASFNHKKGIWEAVGPMTVTPDATQVCTNPGYGILAPGWHGPQPKPPKKPDKCDPNTSCCGSPGPGGGPMAALAEGRSRAAFQPPHPLETSCAPPCPTNSTFERCLESCNTEAKLCKSKNDRIALQNGNSCRKSNVPFLKGICYIAVLIAEQVGDLQCDIASQQCRNGCSDCIPAPSDLSVLGFLEQEPPLIDTIHQLAVRAAALIQPYQQNPDTIPQSVDDELGAIYETADQVAGGDLTAYYERVLGPLETETLAEFGGQERDLGNAPDYPILYYAKVLRADATIFELRGSTGSFGEYTLFVPRDGDLLNVNFYDPRTKLYGTVLPRLAPAYVDLLPRVHLAPLPPDSSDADSDGLADLAEFVVGTDPRKADTDGDGVNDGAELDSGTNPLDSIPAAIGIIATADTPGNAVDVCTNENLAIVADSYKGVTVFNVFNGMNPVAVSQVPTPGIAKAVACAGNLVAVADDTSGLAIVDITDPPAARVVHQLRLPGSMQAVVAQGGVAYAGTSIGTIVVVDLSSGTELSRTSVTGAVQDLQVEGDYLYVLTSGTLSTYSIAEGNLSLVSSIASPGSAGSQRLRLFVGSGIAYATFVFGYNTFDLADPANPKLVSNGVTNQAGWRQIVDNGSGLGLATVGPNSPDTEPHDVSLFDTHDPTQTNVLLTTFITPGIANSVAIHDGLCYVADGLSGMEVINYLAYDAHGIAPSITLSANFPLSPAQVEEGKSVLLTARVTDDVQVRNVDFLVDGQKVASDGTYPFEVRITTPLLSQEATFTVSALARDTGGNTTATTPILVTLLPDTTAPHVANVSPKAGGYAIGGNIAVRFNEPVAAASLSNATIELFAAGPDGMAGTPDDTPVTGGAVSYRTDAQTAILIFNTSPAGGLYRGVVSPPIADLAGNPLAAPFEWTFQVLAPGSVNGTIYYSRLRDPAKTDGTIWKVNGDGTGNTFVVDGEWPRLSPDGNKLLFHRGSTFVTSSPIWTRDLTTGSELQLFADYSNYEVSYDFTPDSLSFVFDYYCGIYRENIDGTGSTNLFFVDCYDDVPVVRGSDGMIAFHNSFIGVMLADANGGNRHTVPNTRPNDFWPAWSPDGQWISFIRVGTAPFGNFFKIHPDGTGLTQLTFLDSATGDVLQSQHTWTPDGAFIVLGGTVGETPGLYAADTAGLGTLSLLPVPAGQDIDFVGSVSP